MNLMELPEHVVHAYMAIPQRNEFLPVSLEDGALHILLLKERAAPFADFLAWSLGLRAQLHQPLEAEFYSLLEEATTLWEQHNTGAEEDQGDIDETEVLGQELIGWSYDDAPIVRLVNRVLQQAIRDDVSDIHFEGQRGQFIIRYRLDGQLHTVQQLNKNLQPTVLARLKVMGDMDVAECRIPQDGRIQVRQAQRDVDIRISTVPTLSGEKAVLRILDRSKTILNLTNLGMQDDDLRLLRDAVRAPHGVVLVTGPTGSGKTTTLYASLAELDLETNNVMTVEDPVEYYLAGVNQIQVNRAAGVDFASAIRSFLRQDPDIILIGEVRDRETVSAAIQASLTGHLVLTTLHTNDSPTAVARLLEMDLEPFLLATSLLMVMAQRLVRVVCPHCSSIEPISDSTLEMVTDSALHGMRTQRTPTGCDRCMHTGYRGRQGIFEFMPVDESMRSLIIKRESIDAFNEYRNHRNYKTMWDRGMELVSSGVTSVEEVLRVTRS